MKTTIRAVTMCAAAGLVIFALNASCETEVAFDKGIDVKEFVLKLKHNTPAIVPLPGVPAKAAPRACRPFLISSAVGGVEETAVIERACTPENEPVWTLMVGLRGSPGTAVKINSGNYPAEKAVMESRIRGIVLYGISQEDADFIVLKTGPMLRLANGSATPEKEKLLAEAAKALKEQLARP